MKKTYEAPDIHCHSCAGLIKETLEEEVPGVGVSVDVGAKHVTVEYPDGASEDAVMRQLADLGYPATEVGGASH